MMLKFLQFFFSLISTTLCYGLTFIPTNPLRTSTLRSTSSLQMKIKVGIVGLPNVGKSTLFNALAQKSIAQAENFPFCTIEPNVSPIPIPDKNLHKLATLAKSKKFVPATLHFIDVAGLVKNASKGEGLGNRFLATVRECDVIIHVIRNYIDDDIIHVEGAVDPVADAEVVNLELILADLAHVEKRLDRNCIGEERESLEKVFKGLQKGIPARSIGLSESQKFSIKSMGLLTLKPVIYSFNVDEIDFILDMQEASDQASGFMKEIQYCDQNTDTFVVVSAKLEAELGCMNLEKRNNYLESLGIEPSTEDELDHSLSYNVLPLLVKGLLGLSLAYTGPGVPPERSQTTKTHLFKSGSMSASDLAGKLHGEIQRGFIRAEVMNANELTHYQNYNSAKDDGCVRIEGRDYIVQPDDVVLIKWK